MCSCAGRYRELVVDEEKSRPYGWYRGYNCCTCTERELLLFGTTKSHRSVQYWCLYILPLFCADDNADSARGVHILSRVVLESKYGTKPSKSRLQEIQGRNTPFQLSVLVVFRKVVIRPAMASNPVHVFRENSF